MRAALCAFVVASGLAVAPGAGADTIVEGTVVKVEHQEIYVNFATAEGVGDGARLRIKRAIRLRHPVTRAAIQDWIPVGAATVTQAGARLSRAIVGELVDAIRVGDIAEALVEADAPPAPTVATPPAPSAPAAPAAPAAPPVDAATAAVLAAFTAQTGRSLDARIATWERYLSTHGGSPYAPAIREDVDALQALREQLKPRVTADVVVDRLAHDAPAEAPAGASFPVVFVLARPERIASAYLHVRTAGERSYTRALLVRAHEIYLHGDVPESVVRAPGVEYFVEVSTPDGRSGLALGSPSDPIAVIVKPPPLADRFGEAAGRTTVTLAGEYLSFASLDTRDGDRDDFVYRGTVDVGYRLTDTVQRVGVGYGVIGGAGGREGAVWDAARPRPETGFHYGYADVELGTDRGGAPATIGGRVIAGVGREGFGMGLEARGRVGDREHTNVLVSVERIPELGWATDVRFGARPAGDLLVGVAVGATDQPTRGDVAAKLATEVAWVGSPHLAVRVRGSWQGRSTAHGGVGGGAALEVTW